MNILYNKEDHDESFFANQGLKRLTARINEAVELIYNVGKGFSENKNGQTEVNFDLSTQVMMIGIKFSCAQM